MRAWPYMPGVPAAGHVTARGWWHPGRIEGCAKCPPPDPVCAECGKPVHRQRDDAWYHNRNASTSCYPGTGNPKQATPRSGS